MLLFKIFLKKDQELSLGGRINFGIMLRLQKFYNKFCAKSYYWWVKNNINIGPKLESVTTYNIGFVVKLL